MPAFAQAPIEAPTRAGVGPWRQRPRSVARLTAHLAARPGALLGSRLSVLLAAGVVVACGGAREDPNTPAASREQEYASQLSERCDDGELERCVELALRMLDDDAHARDEVRGVELLEYACLNGQAQGCRGLARAYDAGTGVSPDTGRAMELYTRACAMKDYRACHQAGSQHLNGELRAPDPEAALTYLRVACDEGDVLEACLELAALLERGEGVPQDREAARALRRRVCDAGMADACEPVVATGD